MNDCPEGRMSEDKMKEMFATTVAKSKVTFSINIQDQFILKKIFIKKFANVVLFSQGGSGNQFVEQLFRVFDKNGDGGIDFNVCSQAKLVFKSRHNFNRSSSLLRTCAAQMILRRNLGEESTYKT